MKSLKIAVLTALMVSVAAPTQANDHSKKIALGASLTGIMAFIYHNYCQYGKEGYVQEGRGFYAYKYRAKPRTTSQKIFAGTIFAGLTAAVWYNLFKK